MLSRNDKIKFQKHKKSNEKVLAYLDRSATIATLEEIINIQEIVLGIDERIKAEMGKVKSLCKSRIWLVVNEL